MRHRMGRTSYAVIREKLRNEDPEKKLPNRIKMFDFTHKRPGCSMDDEFTEKLEKIQRELSLQPEEMQQDNDVIDETFTKVMGRDRRGYVRMFGPGVTPKQVIRSDFQDNSKQIGF
ncbi:uncharacterized protein LOC122082077 [Macadamia integrifolia]|uniref:uncharacterized protein LOC122082077 n=1 Tax=Macadamia integrifolia TaxID=60698 RepID=UPI001C4E9EDE|nr:uncharacterized protein LOC122082077 [Macadamia integrifolia]